MTAPRCIQLCSPAPDGLARLSFAADEPAERQWFMVHAADEAATPAGMENETRLMTAPAEPEVLHAEAPVPARWTMATAPARHSSHAETSRLRRQARRVIRPIHFLRVEIASLVELITSYFMLLGAGAMQGNAAANRAFANLFVPIPRNTMPAPSAALTPRVLFCPGTAGRNHGPAVFAFPVPARVAASLYSTPIS